MPSDILYVVTNHYSKHRYYQSLESLVGAFAKGYCNTRDEVHTYVLNGSHPVPDIPTSLLVEVSEKGRQNPSPSSLRSLAQEYTQKIEQALAA